MKAATIREIKAELNLKSEEELVALCLSLSRFKKENKELLTYLLFEAGDEEAFIATIKEEITEEFTLINKSNFYYVKKSARKILRMVKKYIRYSKQKQTEAELLIHFCQELRECHPSIRRSTTMVNLYERQVELIHKALSTLHEDLQFDYQSDLDRLQW